jgi:hypothetical protein
MTLKDLQADANRIALSLAPSMPDGVGFVVILTSEARFALCANLSQTAVAELLAVAASEVAEETA